MTKRSYGDGGIDARGRDTWRLRYRVKRVRYVVTFTAHCRKRRRNCVG
jgi:hypothetical protein